MFSSGHRVRSLVVALIAFAAAGWLTACGGGGGSTGTASVAAEEPPVGAVPAYNTSRMSVATAKPVDAYVMLGGRAKTCWFNPSAPLFPDHVYRADVSPDGQKVKITCPAEIAYGAPESPAAVRIPALFMPRLGDPEVRIETATGLPVFDYTTMANYVFSGLVRKRFQGIY